MSFFQNVSRRLRLIRVVSFFLSISISCFLFFIYFLVVGRRKKSIALHLYCTLKRAKKTYLTVCCLRVHVADECVYVCMCVSVTSEFEGILYTNFCLSYFIFSSLSPYQVSNKDQPTSPFTGSRGHQNHVLDDISLFEGEVFRFLSSWSVYPVSMGVREDNTSACAASHSWPLGIARTKMREKKKRAQSNTVHLSLST